jgi:outer membrane protein assembly factor BamB
MSWLNIFLSLVLFTASSLMAQDWPQFLGPNRDGQYQGVSLVQGWGREGPSELWRRPVGSGFAGPVVADGRLILFHRLNDHEVVEAWNAVSGEPIWRYDYVTTYRDDFGFDEGPRAVPVVVDGKVFTFGAQGHMHAFDLETGDLVWGVDTRVEFGVRKGFFGSAGSPLIDSGHVIANIGGAGAGVVAFDADTGEVAWTSLDDDASYSSGIRATFGGVPHAVFFTRSYLAGLDPTDGSVRFTQRWRSRLMASVNAATPIVVDDFIFVSSAYGTGAGLFRVNGDQLDQVWISDEVMSNHYATSVYHEGHLYGFHGRQEYSPNLRAVELQTGQVKWDIPTYGAGTITVADGRLLIIRESGELVMAEASPEAFSVIDQAQLLDPVIRAYPALANGKLYVRNENTLVCFDLAEPSVGDD